MDQDIDEIDLCLEEVGHNLTLQYCRHRDCKENHIFLKFREFSVENSSLDLTAITVLDLSRINALKILPTSVRGLNLKKLLLSCNMFEEVPPCLYTGLANLESLDLSYNLISSFDIEPACVKKIATLKINDNMIYNFPQWIQKSLCPNLRELDYSRNFMVQLNPTRSLCLEKLKMRNSQLVESDFGFLQSVTTLTHLDIGNDRTRFVENRFRDPHDLFSKLRWKNLEVLNLNNITLSVAPRGIFQHTNLTELYLVNCDLSWICEEIVYLTKLEILDVSHNSVCSLPAFLTCLPNLRVIRAQYNKISSICEFLATLKVLDLYFNYLEEVPCDIDKIKYIDLEKNFFSTLALKCREIYSKGLKKFRKRLSYTDREFGARRPDEDDEEEECLFSLSSSEDSGEGSMHDNYSVQLEDEECWEEENPIKFPRVRHPDITPSDDEWDGKIESTSVPKKPDLPLWYDTDEDRVFCDAEQS